MNRFFIALTIATVGALTAANAQAQSWSSQSIGNSTYYNGTTSTGGSWSGSSQRIGNSTYYSGTDSYGNSFSGSCQRIGSSTYCY